MIISRSPVRITLGGGGTDLHSYYSKYGGSLIAAAIDKYTFVTAHPRFPDDIRLKYSKIEQIKEVNEIKHNIFREALKLLNIKKSIELTSLADVPGRSGVGTSGSFTVSLLNALHAYKREFISQRQLAEEACKIEIEILKEPIGKQDQYACAYGGLNHIRFNPDETVFVNPVISKRETKEDLDSNLLLFYTGIHRKASTILTESKQNMGNLREHVDTLRDLSEEMASALKNNDLSCFGELMHTAWQYKKKTGKVSNPEIDKYYEKVRSAGALGGKILGAGGGGFLLVYCEQPAQKKVRERLSDLKETEFHLEPQGCRIIYVEE